MSKLKRHVLEAPEWVVALLAASLLAFLLAPRAYAAVPDRTVLEFGASVGPSWATLSDNDSRTAMRVRLWAGPSWRTGSLRVGVANGRFGSDEQSLDYVTFPVEFLLKGRRTYFAAGFEFRNLVGISILPDPDHHS